MLWAAKQNSFADVAERLGQPMFCTLHLARQRKSTLEHPAFHGRRSREESTISCCRWQSTSAFDHSHAREWFACVGLRKQDRRTRSATTSNRRALVALVVDASVSRHELARDCHKREASRFQSITSFRNRNCGVDKRFGRANDVTINGVWRRDQSVTSPRPPHSWTCLPGHLLPPQALREERGSEIVLVYLTTQTV